MKKRVVVAMSGGVDSSVSALLLKQKGYDVVGMFMTNWEEGDECPAKKDYEDVVRVCDQIGIPFYGVNFAKDYWDRVFSEFLEELKLGLTPNPDVLCNREIKFKALYDKAMELGVDALATGHYCRTGIQEGAPRLLRGLDPNKDQSYFLYAIDGKKLSNVRFPIGEICKKRVREIAKESGLPTAEKKDSTGICFIGKRNFKSFLSQYLGYTPGDIETVEGEVVGRHDGVAYYTIGQRKGLKIGGEGEAWFVVGKDIKRNVVRVCQGQSHPALFSDTLKAGKLTWIAKEPTAPFSCTAKIRYRQKDAPCEILSIEDGVATVHFETPQRAVTPSQSIVFYQGDECLGGGIIR